MALETTASTIEEIVQTESIHNVIMEAAKQFAVSVQFAQEFSLIGKGSGVLRVPRDISDTGTLADYDGPGETTTLASIQYDMAEATITPTEFACKRTITDIAKEDNILGDSIEAHLFSQMPQDLSIAIDDDLCALYGSLSTSVGTSGVDLSLADMAGGIAQLRMNEIRAPGGVVFILDDQQASDYEAALNASTATMLNDYVERNPDGGLNNGYLGKWMGHPVWSTGLTDSGGGNVTGAVFTNGRTNPRSAAFGVCVSRMPRPEIFRNPSMRNTEIIMTMRVGVGELQDLAGVKIVTDA